MGIITKGALAALMAIAATGAFAQDKITIATVNNGDMIRMQGLTAEFTAQYPSIEVEWVTLEENILRQNVTIDIATGGGQYDVITIGTYEAPIWAANGWLVPLNNLGSDYDVDDLLPAVRSALSFNGTLFAAPFYGESSLTYYRKDLFEAAGLSMPDDPTWDFIGKAARALNSPENGVAGICLRGKPGWGENMGFLNTLVHAFGGGYFAEDWTPQLDGPIWSEALNFYVDLLQDAGPAGVTSNGFNENLTLVQQGKCAMWVDSSVAASFLVDPSQSSVADQIGFALSPTQNDSGNRGNWLWSWALAVPVSSDASQAAQTFISWATSKGYTELVAEREGWANVPPATRTSLYKNENYLAAAPFAEVTLQAMNAVNTDVPHESGNFPTLPEYQAFGTDVAQIVASALNGDITVDEALTQAQSAVQTSLKDGGYIN